MPNKIISYVANTLNKPIKEIEQLWNNSKVQVERHYDTENNYALIMQVFKTMLSKENLNKLQWELKEIHENNTNFNVFLKEQYLKVLLESNTPNNLPCDIEDINELKELIYSLCDDLYKKYKSFSILLELNKLFFNLYNKEYPNMTEKTLETYYKKWLLDAQLKFETNIINYDNNILGHTKRDNINTNEYPSKIYMGIAFGDNLDKL